MALNIEDKKAIVASVSEAAGKAVSAVVADTRGIGVVQMTKLRKQCRDNNVYLHIVRNTLLSRAVEGTEFECMREAFKGPSILALSMEHPGAAARIFKEFAKTNDKFVVKGLAFEGKYYDGADIDVLATLPTYEEGVAQLLATMKEAAAGKLARTLNALADKLKGEEAAAA